MSLTSAEKKDWAEKIKEGVFFLVGVEVIKERKGTYINILRHFNGNVRGMPSIEKGLKDKGRFSKTSVVDEFYKTQSTVGLFLQDAPDHIVDDIMFIDGYLHWVIRDLFVDAYYKAYFSQIESGVIHWETIKGLLASVNPEQAAKDLAELDKNKESATDTAQVLTPYQVGDNDVVVAYSKENAIKLLCDFSSCNEEFEFMEDDVEDLTYKLDEVLKDKEGGDFGTLREWVHMYSKPNYLYGWE